MVRRHDLVKAMNVADTKRDMEECVTSLKERLRGVNDPELRLRLVAQAKHQIRLVRQAYKRKIDEHWGYSVHMRAGIERKLQEVTEDVLNRLDQLEA
jgi:hypothetical protein